MYCISITYSCVVANKPILSYADVDCVWPGDADYNGIVNNNDILYIGMDWGSQGNVRPNASLSFIKQPCIDWSDFWFLDTLAKHTDTNGDGGVYDDDTLAVQLNYGLIHPKLEEVVEDTRVLPELTITFLNDTAYLGQMVFATVTVGSNSQQVSNLYGIAFRVNYNSSLIDSSSFGINYANSWLVPDTSRISLVKDFYQIGFADIASCRTSHDGLNGNGLLGTIYFKIKGDSLPIPIEQLQISINTIFAIKANGDSAYLTESADTLSVLNSFNAVSTIHDKNVIKLFPVPADNSLQIISSEEISSLLVSDLLGRSEKTLLNLKAPYILQTENLAEGMHVLTIKTISGLTMKKFIVIHK